MSETIAELIAAEQAAQTPAPSPPPVPEAPSTPEAPPSPEPVVAEPPAVDDFIREASEATGIDLSDIKDKGSFLQSYAALRRKMSERDELHKLGENILNSPYADKVLAVLKGQMDEPPPLTQQTPTPSTQAPSEPEWDASWESLVQGENPHPEILAKYNRRRAWERQRAESLIKSEHLQQLASDPESYIRKLIEPLVNPIKETQAQEAARFAAEQELNERKAVLAPVEKQIFTGEWGDWNNVSPFGDKVKQRYLSEPTFAQASPNKWLKHCIDEEKRSLPQPKPTLPVPAAAQRAPNAGSPPLDPNAIEKSMDEWCKAHPGAGVMDIEKQYKKLQGQAP